MSKEELMMKKIPKILKELTDGPTKRKYKLTIIIEDWRGKYVDEETEIDEITYQKIQRLLPKDVPV